ncbi:MAG: hypothetical protein M1816_000019 [Peltula sp. TS41687]|nr:MAG: hypothetical protein M1816_000019 [Peltula sp. TS41687]
MSITWDKHRPAAKITPTFQYKLADNPNLTVCGILIDYPPNGSTAPHRHGTASVIGYVVDGECLSAMNDGEPKVYKKGESWYEPPGCFHRIADNNSKTERNVVHATFVIKTEILEKEGPAVLVQFDPKYADGVKEQPQE